MGFYDLTVNLGCTILWRELSCNGNRFLAVRIAHQTNGPSNSGEFGQRVDLGRWQVLDLLN